MVEQAMALVRAAGSETVQVPWVVRSAKRKETQSASDAILRLLAVALCSSDERETGVPLVADRELAVLTHSIYCTV